MSSFSSPHRSRGGVAGSSPSRVGRLPLSFTDSSEVNRQPSFEPDYLICIAPKQIQFHTTSNAEKTETHDAIALCRDMTKGVYFASFRDRSVVKRCELSTYEYAFSGNRLQITLDHTFQCEWEVRDDTKFRTFRQAVESALSTPSATGKIPMGGTQTVIDKLGGGGSKLLQSSSIASLHRPPKASHPPPPRMSMPAPTGSRGRALVNKAKDPTANITQTGPIKSSLPPPMDFHRRSPAAADTSSPVRSDAQRALAESRRIDLENTKALHQQQRAAICQQAAHPSPPTRSVPDFIKRPYGSKPLPSAHLRPLTNSISSWLSKPSATSSYRAQALNGFKNVGNTCYINAVLQSLLGMPTFLDSLQDDRINSMKHELERPMPQDSVFLTLYNMSLQRSGASGPSGSGPPIDTECMKAILGRRNRTFSGYSQQDAHEFFSEFLNFIHTDVERCLLSADELKAREQEEAAFAAPKKKDGGGGDNANNRNESNRNNEEKDDPFEFDEDAHPHATTNNDQHASSSETYTTAAISQPILPLECGTDVPASMATDDSIELKENAPPPPPHADDSPAPLVNGMSPARHESLTLQLMRLSPVLRNFQCELELELQCTDCKLTRKVRESFHDFSVDMPERNRITTHTTAPSSRSASPPSPAAAAAAASTSSPPPSIFASKPKPLSKLPEITAPLSRSDAIEIDDDDSSMSGSTSKSNTPDKKDPHRSDFDARLFQTEATRNSNGASTTPRPPSSPSPTGSSPSIAQASSTIVKPSSNAFDRLYAGSQLANQPPVRHNLTQLVKQFFHPRVIEYRCDCKGQSLRQTPKILTLPRILVLHLKRFQFDEHRGRFEKRKDIVAFENVIDMSEFVAEDVRLPPGITAADASADQQSMNLLAAFDATTPTRVDRKRRAESRSPSPTRTPKKAKSPPPPQADSSGDSDDDDADMRRALAESLKSSRLPPPLTEEEQIALAIEASKKEAEELEERMRRQRANIKHTYRLTSVILHKGESASSGHYVSQIREDYTPNSSPFMSNSTSSSNTSAAAANGNNKHETTPTTKPKTIKIWKEYDDAYVTRLTDDHARQAAEKEGYIFFYAYEPNAQPDTKKPNNGTTHATNKYL